MNIKSSIINWLDRLLIFNLFLVIFGAILFVFSIILNSRGIEFMFDVFQFLWKPLFIPSITILISSSLITGLLSWWHEKVPHSEKEI